MTFSNGGGRGRGQTRVQQRSCSFYWIHDRGSDLPTIRIPCCRAHLQMRAGTARTAHGMRCMACMSVAPYSTPPVPRTPAAYTRSPKVNGYGFPASTGRAVKFGVSNLPCSSLVSRKVGLQIPNCIQQASLREYMAGPFAAYVRLNPTALKHLSWSSHSSSSVPPLLVRCKEL